MGGRPKRLVKCLLSIRSNLHLSENGMTLFDENTFCLYYEMAKKEKTLTVKTLNGEEN